MKVLVYTANFNNYDWVYYPINKDKQTTYLYFTDTFIENKIWNFKHVDYNKIHFDPKRVTNYFKVGMHDLPNHDISVWIDSSVKIINSLRLLINYFKKADVDMIGFKHYRRNCVYDEGEECANLKLDDPKIIQDQMQKYRKQNYPVNNGLLETAIMIRKNNKKIKEFSNVWYNEYMSGSRRDQLSVNYALKKSNVNLKHFTFPLRQNKYFKIHSHLNKNRELVK